MTKNLKINTNEEDNWLVKLRIAAGYKTQQEFREALSAKGMEKHTATISLWERDEGGIPISITGSAEQLQILAEVLKISHLDLLAKAGHLTDGQKRGALINEDTLDTLERLDALPEVLQKFIIDIMLESIDKLIILQNIPNDVFAPKVLELLDSYVKGDESLKAFVERLAQND